MKRLTTYFSVLATLLAVLACALFVLLANVIEVEGWTGVAIALLLTTTIVFLLALVIGHFISAPLRDLRKMIASYRSGNDSVPFVPDGRLHEADVLVEDFKNLLDTSNAQCADLVRSEKQQMQFVGDVAHELRTPLTAIRGNAELLKDPDMPQEMREKFCDTIVSESERLTRLTNDLLSLQHIENDDALPEMQRLNLKDVVDAALDALAPVLDDAGAQVEVVGEAPDVLGNADRLRQVVSNLVDNATHFIEPGGHIRVELYGISGNSIIAVKDDGPGFGDVDPAMLFERFFRTDFSRARNTGGSGLGLAIVKSIVEAHDGTVEAYNLPEGGACFIVAIPSVV